MCPQEQALVTASWSVLSEKIHILGNELNQLILQTNQHLYLRLSCEKLTATWNLPFTHCCTLRFKVMSPQVAL